MIPRFSSLFAPLVLLLALPLCACRPSNTDQQPVNLSFPDAGPPHQVGALYLSGTLEPDTAVAITDVLDVKAAALARLRTGRRPAFCLPSPMVQGRKRVSAFSRA